MGAESGFTLYFSPSGVIAFVRNTIDARLTTRMVDACPILLKMRTQPLISSAIGVSMTNANIGTKKKHTWAPPAPEPEHSE